MANSSIVIARREDDPDTMNFKQWRNVLIGNDWGCQVTLNYFIFLYVGQKPVQFNSFGAKSQQTNNENIPAETMKGYKNITKRFRNNTLSGHQSLETFVQLKKTEIAFGIK